MRRYKTGSADRRYAGVLLAHTPPESPLLLNCVVEPAHRVDEPPIVPALALGLTVIVKLTGNPVQPFNEGVTVTVAVNGAKLLFVAVKLPILPVPFKPKPTLTVLVQV